MRIAALVTGLLLAASVANAQVLSDQLPEEGDDDTPVYMQRPHDDGPAEPFLAFCVEQAVVGFKSISLETSCRQKYRLPVARNYLCDYYQRTGFVRASDVFACAAFKQINDIVKARHSW